jgi:L-asparaginase
MFPGISEAVLEAILNIPNLKGLFRNLWCRQRPNRRLVSKSIKKSNFNRFTYRKCDTMLGSVNMGQYETSTGMKEIGVISGKTSPPRLELQN